MPETLSFLAFSLSTAPSTFSFLRLLTMTCAPSRPRRSAIANPILQQRRHQTMEVRYLKRLYIMYFQHIVINWFKYAPVLKHLDLHFKKWDFWFSLKQCSCKCFCQRNNLIQVLICVFMRGLLFKSMLKESQNHKLASILVHGQFTRLRSRQMSNFIIN